LRVCYDYSHGVCAGLVLKFVERKTASFYRYWAINIHGATLDAVLADSSLGLGLRPRFLAISPRFVKSIGVGVGSGTKTSDDGDIVVIEGSNVE
jgi:hypothetical protein